MTGAVASCAQAASTSGPPGWVTIATGIAAIGMVVAGFVFRLQWLRPAAIVVVVMNAAFDIILDLLAGHWVNAIILGLVWLVLTVALVRVAQQKQAEVD